MMAKRTSKTPAQPIKFDAAHAQQSIDAEVSDQARNTILKHAVVAGACQLIPLPFVDDFIMGQVHERMNIALFREHGFELQERGQDILRETESRWLSSMLTSVLMFPVKKILKKVIFVFSIKAVADVASSTFHDGWMIARAIEGRYVDPALLTANDEETFKRLRAAVLLTKSQVDTRPINKGLKTAFSMTNIKKAGESLTGFFKKNGRRDATTDEYVKQGNLDEAIREADRVTSEQKGYFVELDRRFFENLQSV